MEYLFFLNVLFLAYFSRFRPEIWCRVQTVFSGVQSRDPFVIYEKRKSRRFFFLNAVTTPVSHDVVRTVIFFLFVGTSYGKVRSIRLSVESILRSVVYATVLKRMCRLRSIFYFFFLSNLHAIFHTDIWISVNIIMEIW